MTNLNASAVEAPKTWSQHTSEANNDLAAQTAMAQWTDQMMNRRKTKPKFLGINPAKYKKRSKEMIVCDPCLDGSAPVANARYRLEVHLINKTDGSLSRPERNTRIDLCEEHMANFVDLVKGEK